MMYAPKRTGPPKRASGVQRQSDTAVYPGRRGGHSQYLFPGDGQTSALYLSARTARSYRPPVLLRYSPPARHASRCGIFSCGLRKVSHHDARCAARGNAASMISSICSKPARIQEVSASSDSPAGCRSGSRASFSSLRRLHGARSFRQPYFSRYFFSSGAQAVSGANRVAPCRRRCWRARKPGFEPHRAARLRTPRHKNAWVSAKPDHRVGELDLAAGAALLRFQDLEDFRLQDVTAGDR